MSVFKFVIIIIFATSIAVLAQDNGSGTPEATQQNKVADPFGKVDLSKFELKEAPRAEGEMLHEDNSMGHGFDSSKLEELPNVGLEQKAAQLKYEIDMAKKQKSTPATRPAENDALTVDAFGKQPVQIDKCVGKDIDTCMRERAVQQLQQEQKNLELEKAASEKALVAPENNTPPVETVVEETKTSEAQEVVTPVENVADAPAVNPAVAGKEHNVDVVDNAAAPTPNVPDSKLDEGLLKIQNSIKMNNVPGQRLPAQAPNP